MKKKTIKFSAKLFWQRVGHWLYDLFFPPVCRCCGKRMGIFTPTLPQVLCKDCLSLWALETRAMCPRCTAPYFRCRCMPKTLERSECAGLVKLAAYRGECSPVMSSLLLRTKDVNDSRAFEFLTAELTLPVFEAVAQSGVAAEDVIVTFAPRRPSAVAYVGHDQAKCLSALLAKRLEYAHAVLLRRKNGGRAQKDLSAEARAANAASGFRLKRKADLRDKMILLVDDICTTGASLSRCTELLYEAGARSVLAVCVAQTGDRLSKVRRKTRR